MQDDGGRDLDIAASVMILIVAIVFSVVYLYWGWP